MLNHILSDKMKTKSPTDGADDFISVSIPDSLLNYVNELKNTKDHVGQVASIPGVETQGRFASWFSQSDSDPMMPKGFSYQQRLIGFTLCLLAASLCLCLAMVFIPMLATPYGMRKYVILHSMGSLLLISSLGFLLGPWNHLKSLFSAERWQFSVVFLFSVFGGIYSVVVWQSSLFAFFFLVLQILTIVWQILSSIPGGKTGLSAIARGAYWSVRGIGHALPI